MVGGAAVMRHMQTQLRRIGMAERISTRSERFASE
jgi:hypothetical protein